ncbi:MAG: TlpA disulfide reductase family protein [Pirellulaceae bacterium]|nr:TlpA disulfide reductase family protein [Pirellulaceae bacterium]
MNYVNRFALFVGLCLSTLALSCTPKQDDTVAIKKDDSAGIGDRIPAAKIEAAQPKKPTKRKSPVTPLTIGSKAPSIDIEHWVSNGHGKFKPINDFEAGKVYVVEFWATWCGPCVSSMPHLAETQTAFADKNVQLISISDEDPETVAKFLEREVGTPKSSKEPGEGDVKDDKDAEEKQPKKTFGELTSVYCLTTDPDRSVSQDYMEAAGQNGIPTCFIVGKTGQIEWIGHPMGMDEPLAKVVDDTWDREAYLAEFKKSQEREELMAVIMQKMRSGDIDDAMEEVAKARKVAEGDAQTQNMLDGMTLNIVLSPVMGKVRSGDVDGALEMIDEVVKSLPPALQTQVSSFKFRLLMQAKKLEAAAQLLTAMADTEGVEPEFLNSHAWDIYDSAKDDADYPKELVSAAIAAAEKAAASVPENAAALDTLAHLIHLQGDLDRAIEVQTKATEKAGQNAPQIQEFLEQLKAEKAKQ